MRGGELTEEVRTSEVLDVRRPDQDTGGSDARHAQDRCNGDLGAAGHVEVPEHDDGEQAKGEVAEGADGGVEVGEADDDLHIETLAVGADGPAPEVGYRAALQDGHEEEDDAGDDGDGHGGVDDPDVDLLHRHPQEEEADGCFGEHHGAGVGGVA